MLSDLHMSRLIFFFTLLDCVHFTIRLKSANRKSHWNILVFYDHWKIMLDLNISHRKMSNCVPIPLCGFTSAIKLRNFDFKGHQNALIFFDKRMMSDLIMSCQAGLIWFNLEICCQIKIYSFFALFVFFGITLEIFLIFLSFLG